MPAASSTTWWSMERGGPRGGVATRLIDAALGRELKERGAPTRDAVDSGAERWTRSGCSRASVFRRTMIEMTRDV